MPKDTSATSSRGALTQGPVRDRLRDLWLPMIGGVLSVKAIGLSDALFVGLLGEQPLAAISFTFPVVMTLITLAIGLSSGAASVLSRAIGRSADDETRLAIVSGSLALSAALALTMSLVGFIVISPVLSLMGAEGRNLADATLYMQIWFAGSIFLIVPIVANGILRATGDGLSPALLMAAIAGVNIALNPFFIFGLAGVPEFGMHGAAIATVTARALATVGAIWLLIRRDLFSLRKLRLKQGLRRWGSIARIGAPASLSTSLDPVALSIVTAAAATLGQAEVAAFGLASKIQSIALVPLLALSAASAPFAGQNSGAGYLERTRAMLWWCVGIAVTWSTLAAVSFWFGGGWLADAFAPSDAAAGFVTTFLIIVPLSFIGYGAVIALSAALNGLGRPIEALTLSGGRALLLLAPAAWIGVMLDGFRGLVIGFALANLVAGGVAVFRIWRASLAPRDEGTAPDESETQ